jgi:hypothetical protein
LLLGLAIAVSLQERLRWSEYFCHPGYRDEKEEIELMAALCCSCEQGTPIWGEAWWVGGGQYRWVFFDDDKTSETYAEQVTHCRGCGNTLERKEMRAAVLSGG